MRAVVILALLMVLAVIPSLADEVVYFTSGSRMAVKGHKILDNMIHVDLGGDSSMAFPVALVKKVTKSGKAVFESASYDAAANRIANVKGGVGASRTAFASADRSHKSYSRNRSTRAGSTGSGAAAAAQALDNLLLGNNGSRAVVPNYTRPAANHASGAARQLTVAGDKRIFGRTASTNSRSSNGQVANTATTPGGQQILGGEPSTGRKTVNGVEVYGMEENALVQKVWVGRGGRDEARYTSNTVVEGDD